MKRDLELVRTLLLNAETSCKRKHKIGTWEHVSHDEPEEFWLKSHHSSEELYHLDKLEEAGFIRKEHDDHNGQYFEITWAGHEYLDTVRDIGIWEKTKAAVADEGGSASLELVKRIAAAFAKKQIELRTGLTL